jgi:hypothetical protein
LLFSLKNVLISIKVFIFSLSNFFYNIFHILLLVLYYTINISLYNEKSKGCKIELEVAEKNNIPIVYSLDELITKRNAKKVWDSNKLQKYDDYV